MPSTTNRRVYFAKIPDGYPVLDETLRIEESFLDLDHTVLEGGVLLKTLALSVDPYMRGKMRDESKKSYSPAFKIGETISGYGVGKVLRSEHKDLKAGQVVYGILPWTEYALIPAGQVNLSPAYGFRVIEDGLGLPWTTWTGALGMSGKTAHLGLNHFGKPKKGEKIFVSAASGAVGQLVGQFAKKQGLTVIGSAGSDEKVKILTEQLGFDHAFNYKTQDTLAELKRHEPIQIYFDNVGGETLDHFLTVADVGARVVVCGAISQYNNAGEPYGLKNFFNVVSKRISINGFIVGDNASWHEPQYYSEVPELVRSGQIKVLEHVEVGLENAPKCFIDMLYGRNVGKAAVRVADD